MDECLDHLLERTKRTTAGIEKFIAYRAASAEAINIARCELAAPVESSPVPDPVPPTPAPRGRRRRSSAAASATSARRQSSPLYPGMLDDGDPLRQLLDAAGLVFPPDVDEP